MHLELGYGSEGYLESQEGLKQNRSPARQCVVGCSPRISRRVETHMLSVRIYGGLWARISRRVETHMLSVRIYGGLWARISRRVETLV